MKAIYLVRYNKESISETIKEYDLFSIFERGNSQGSQGRTKGGASSTHIPSCQLSSWRLAVKVKSSSKKKKSALSGRWTDI